MDSLSRVISSLIALAGFLVALVAGLSVENPPGVVLTNALVAMIACKILGAGVGSLAQSIATQHVERYQTSTPIPSITGPLPFAEVSESQEKKRAA